MPSLNVTVPVGVPAPGATGLTVAVITSDWPNTEGFAEELSDTELASLFTVCESIEEAALKFASPLYAAVIE